MERLQRVLSAAGVASRRRAEELIADGRVRVDGTVVTELGTKVDPDLQKIEVDGKLIPHPKRRYILLHKPKGYITTTSDERGRDTVMDLIRVGERVLPVGRLDRQTEGLLLMTNDGEVAHRVMHPRFEIDKEYEALLDGHPPPAALERLRRGIVVDGERATPEMVRPIRITEDGTIVRIVIHEGRNRIVRRMFDEIGYPVLRLVRTRIGPLNLGAIPRGTWRDLTEGELRQLREALHLTDEDTQFRPFASREQQPPMRPSTPQGRPPARPGSQQGAPRPYRGSAPPQRPGGPTRRPGSPPLRPGGPPRRPVGPPQRQSGPPQRPADTGSGGRPPRPSQWVDRLPENRQEQDNRGGGTQPGRGRRQPGGPGPRNTRPPIHNRNRRPGGGGKEHDR